MTAKIWAKTGSRPVVVRQNGYKSANFVGAVNPESGDKFCLIFDGIDTQVMSRFLIDLSKKVGDGKQ